MNPLARFAKTLSNIFVPIIPAIVASGLLMKPIRHDESLQMGGSKLRNFSNA
ncbi:hypothetical protein ACEQPO_28245 [Bacillus sp. SL00103]